MKSNDDSLGSKIGRIICTVLTALIAVLAAAIFINIFICRAKNKPVSFFGTSFAIVRSGSMEPEIMTGDLIIFHLCDVDKVVEGDNIVFVGGEHFKERAGETIVHKAIKIYEDGSIQTRGVNNSGPDEDLVTANNFYGICTKHSTFWGKVFSFLGKFGIIIIIVVVALPFIIGQVVKIIKFSKENKAEKLQKAADVLTAESDKNIVAPTISCEGAEAPPATNENFEDKTEAEEDENKKEPLE